MNEENIVQIGLRLDTSEFKQELTEAGNQLETQLQGLVQRTTALGQGAQPPEAGASPPPPPAPTPPAVPSEGERGASPVASAWEELGKIKAIAQSAPDVARAALDGQGGFANRVARSAAVAGMDDPEVAGQYQQLLEAIKELTKSIREPGGDADPASKILGFLRGNAMLGVVGNVAQQAVSGNIVGAGATGIGAGLGFLLGGPLGAQAGASLGGMAGGAITSFLSQASEAQQFGIEAGQISARFGGTAEIPDLTIDSLSSRNTYGYSVQETAGLFDLLRQSNVINGIDEESKELVEQLQGLSRALGENTEALTQSYSSYRTMGGEEDATTYMAQMVAGAVAAGMRENMAQYQEIVGSAQMQMVYRSGIADTNDAGLRGIQGTLATYLGQENRTSKLLQDNPMMAQQMMSSLLQTGASRSGMDAQASMLRVAGAGAHQVTEGFITPEQQVENAIALQRSISQDFVRSTMGVMGYSDMSQLFAAAQANPNLFQDLISSSNPNEGQADFLQKSLTNLIASYMQKDPSAITGQERMMAVQSLQAYASSGGQLTPETITADGKAMKDAIEEANKTEAEQAREAANNRHKEMMRMMEPYARLLTSIDQAVVAMVRYVQPIAEAVANTLGLKPQETFAMPGSTSSAAVPEGAEDRQALARQLREDAERAIAAQKESSNGIFSMVGQHIANNAPEAAVSAIEATVPGGRMATAAARLIFRRNDEEGRAARQRPNMDETPVDAEFNDIPESGIQAAPGFDTFRFRQGDIINAQSGGADNSSRSISPNINITINAPSNADAEWMRGAARAGVSSGMDEFVSNWSGRNRGGRMRAANATSY